MGSFAAALRLGEGAACRFLPPIPTDEAGWLAALDAAGDRAPSRSAAWAARLADRQAQLGAGPAAVENARALADGQPRTLAVVTGQQPGLFGGPLLTYHKAAGAIHLARRLDGLGGRRVVPVFWLASEDHDFEEANRALVVDRQGQPRTLKLPTTGDGRSIADLPVPVPDSEAVLAELAATLPDTERGAAALTLARRESGEDFATWSVRTMLRVLGDAGLVVLEPEFLTRADGAGHAWLLDHAETIRASVHARGDALRAVGLPAPLWPQADDATALFYRATPGGRRLRVGLAADDAVHLRGERSDMARAGLRAELIARPAAGSGNVIGRVFLQNRGLPVLAYVAGPTEIAYQAQLAEAHQDLGVPFPLALPRPEGTWFDRKLVGILEAFERTPADVLRGALEPPALQDAAVGETLGDLERHLRQVPEAVRALAERGGRGAAALGRALERLQAEWRKASGRVQAAFEEDAGVGRRRWARLLAWLRPGGKPQERALSPLALVARHGLEPVRAGLLSLDPLPPVHHVLHLDGEPPAA